MTSIQSGVTRRGRFNFASYGLDKLPVVVTLSANGSQNDMVTVRLLRRREGFSMDLLELYALMVRQKAQHKHLEKARAKRKSVKRFHALTR